MELKYTSPIARTIELSASAAILEGSYKNGGGGSYDGPDDISDNGEY